MPIASVPFGDRSFGSIDFAAKAKVSRSTATIVLTKDYFYFGDLGAFSEKFSDVRNKFFIPHTDGRPEISILLDTMGRWIKTRAGENRPISTDIVVILPSAEIPVPIVIQVLHWMKESKLFDDAILASELQ